MKRPKRIEPEVQLAADMLELMGSAAFRRFLFTIVQRSGICSVAYGTEVATSYSEGRRSLGIEILRMADDALPVRAAENSPMSALALALDEGLRPLTATEEPDDGTEDEDYHGTLERR